MTESDKTTLATLGRLVVADSMSVAQALRAAYTLGELEGQLKVARITENAMQEFLKVAA
jgi:hypothetical protein